MQNKLLTGLAAVIAAILIQQQLVKGFAQVPTSAPAQPVAAAATKAEASTPRMIAPMARPVQASAVGPQESESDHRLNQINTLVRVVIPTPAKIAALRPLLSDPALADDIRGALNDPNAFSGKAFTRKLRLLDAMYEGMKFPDQGVRQKYFELSAEILNEASSTNKNFLADRTEIALVLSKNFPEEARRIRANASKDGKTAFNEANQIASLYDVAL